MKHRRLLTLAALFVAAPLAAAEPDYRTIKMEINVARPATEVWARVGKYCDIAEWMSLECKITSGDGGVGTVRVLAGGRVSEILIGMTALSYGYTQPAVEGRFYDLYHGFLEARPLTATTSKLVYTLVMDQSQKADAAAKDADLARRRATFEAALQKMKALAEGK
jgi:hypothetical protein